jgi:uncharacterized protein (DUF849 family)
LVSQFLANYFAMRPSAEQVRLASKIIEGLALEVATSDDAREVLHLKGGDSLQA